MGRKASTSTAIAKSFNPETRETADKSATSVHITASDRKRRPPIIGAGPMNKHIPPKASLYTELTRDRAEKLATLRRGRFDEFTWAAMTGFVASLPAAVHSYIEVKQQNAFSLSLPQAVDFGVLLIFLTLTIVTLLSRNSGMTSMEYLEHHFGPDPDAPQKRPLFPLFGNKPASTDDN